MAIGKPRVNKRPAGGSCSSTITTVVLTAVSVFGIWLIITSNSTTSPSNTNALINNEDDSTSSFVKLNRKIPIDDATKENLVDLSFNTSVSEEDVQQNDEFQEMGLNNNKPADDDGDRLAEPKTEVIEQESSSSTIIIDEDDESLNDSDVGKQEAEQEEAKEEQEMEIVEDINTNDQSEEKEHEQKAQKIKVTHDQQTDDSDSGNEVDKLTEAGNEDDDIRDLEDNQEQELTDQEHEKGSENQQEQQEPQEQNEDDDPIESHSIAAETKARVENQEALDIRNKMEQAKIESSTIGNTTIPMIKPSNVEYSTVSKDKIYSESDTWELCNVTTGTDYIPCLDKEIAITNSLQWHHYERHCPNEPPLCLVPLPEAYKTPIPWPQSRDKIWFLNVQNKALSDKKELQNWVKVTGEFITFPKGAHHYIEFLQEAVPEIRWGKQTRVVLNIGCGVASFGGYLFDKDVLAVSIVSKDEHEAQIQFTLERGIPAICNVMGTRRLPFPSRVFDLVHCVHCKIPWHKDGGIQLLEVNRLLRPGGYFVWSATPVYRTLEEDLRVWKEMSTLTVAMCWELVTIKKDKLNAIGVAIYHKPDYSNECYNVIKKQQPPMCKPDDDPNFAWYVPLQTCMHMVPMRETGRGSHWPKAWPGRVEEPPYWLNGSQVGIYGKQAPDDFKQDYEHWKRVISKSYMSDGLGINWWNIRNVMDMRAVYGGFAAALKDLKVWVLNVVNVDSPDTLEIIFERGLLGIYHDWCESFSTYPRTYDLLHADHLFSNLKNRCKIKAVMAEIDRILRPEGNLIARDEPSMIREMEKLLKSLHWEVNSTFMNEEGVICGRKSMWRPTTYVTPS